MASVRIVLMLSSSKSVRSVAVMMFSSRPVDNELVASTLGGRPRPALAFRLTTFAKATVVRRSFSEGGRRKPRDISRGHKASPTPRRSRAAELVVSSGLRRISTACAFAARFGRMDSTAQAAPMCTPCTTAAGGMCTATPGSWRTRSLVASGRPHPTKTRSLLP
jgi:hypothetical protein